MIFFMTILFSHSEAMMHNLPFWYPEDDSISDTVQQQTAPDSDRLSYRNIIDIAWAPGASLFLTNEHPLIESASETVCMILLAKPRITKSKHVCSIMLHMAVVHGRSHQMNPRLQRLESNRHCVTGIRWHGSSRQTWNQISPEQILCPG